MKDYKISYYVTLTALIIFVVISAWSILTVEIKKSDIVICNRAYNNGVEGQYCCLRSNEYDCTFTYKIITPEKYIFDLNKMEEKKWQ